MSFFFDDMPEEIAGRRNAGAGFAELYVLSATDAESVARAYYGIESRAVRSAMFKMVKAMARSGKDR